MVQQLNLSGNDGTALQPSVTVNSDSIITALTEKTTIQMQVLEPFDVQVTSNVNFLMD